MPRSGVNGTYSLPGAQAGATPLQPISSATNNAGWSDVAQTFNTVQPVAYGGTGVADGRPLDNTFGIKSNTDTTKIGVFNAAGIPTGTTRTYDLPYHSGTLGLVSDIRGQIYGLTLSNNVTDATNDIDIAAGAAVDMTGVTSMLLASSLTKRLDAAWAVGNNQGGLDTGSIANTWYAVYIIRRPDTGVVDAIFSANLTTPTLPANYTQYRRIGYFLRASAAIVPFLQFGDEFQFMLARGDVNVTNLGTTATTYTLNLPPLVTSMLRISGFNAAAIALIFVGTSGVTDPTINVPPGNLSLATPAANVGSAATLNVRVSALSQIFAKSNLENTNFTANVYGWIDSRSQ